MALVINASRTVYRFGDPSPPVISITGSADFDPPTVNYGRLDLNSDGSWTLMPENVSHYALINDPVIISAHDNVADATITKKIDAFATFPYQPDWRFEGEVDDRTEISTAEDGSEVFGAGGFFATWNLQFQDREFDQYQEALAFRYKHAKWRFFYLYDVALEELSFVRFDSAIRRQPDWAEGVSYSFAVKAPSWAPTIQ